MKYGPEGVGRRKSSVCIGLGMVFWWICEDCQEQEIWPGRRGGVKITNLHWFVYSLPRGSGGQRKARQSTGVERRNRIPV